VECEVGMSKVKKLNLSEIEHLNFDNLEELMQVTTKLRNLSMLGGILLLNSVQLGTAATPAEVYRKAVPAVVLLISMEPDSKDRSKGTGSMITNQHVLTNAHVVLGDNGRPLGKTLVFYSFENPNDGIEQNFRKGRQAEVRHYSERLDLALLEVEDPPKVTPLNLGPADGVRIGDPVLAIGHPESGGLWSLTSGRIGARIRNVEGVPGNHIFQTEASLNRGNSGGPLLNEDGQMVGVNTSIARKAADGLAITGINFAVQSDVAREWLQSVRLRLPKARAVAENRLASTPTPEKPVATIEETKPAATTAATKLTPPIPPVKETPAPAVVTTPPQAKQEPQLLTKPRPFRDDQLFNHISNQTYAEFSQQLEAEFEAFQKQQNQ
jgi:serine protease Do